MPQFADSDAVVYYGIIALVWWAITLLAVVVIVLMIAKWAFARADSEGTPKVLAGIADLVRGLSWFRAHSPAIIPQPDPADTAAVGHVPAGLPGAPGEALGGDALADRPGEPTDDDTTPSLGQW
jgi:hypothetical protein